MTESKEKFRNKVIGKLFGTSNQSKNVENKLTDNAVIDLNSWNDSVSQVTEYNTKVYSVANHPDVITQPKSIPSPTHPTSSSSSQSDTDTQNLRACRRKKRRKKGSEDISAQAVEVKDKLSVLSKNKRRKLKKKRREKEKKANTTTNTFTFTCTVSKDDLSLKAGLLKTKNFAQKEKFVSDFLSAVWDVYSADSSIEKKDEQFSTYNSLLLRIENSSIHDLVEVEKLHKLVTSIVVPNNPNLGGNIEDYVQATSLDSDVTDLLKTLIYYWTGNVLNR